MTSDEYRKTFASWYYQQYVGLPERVQRRAERDQAIAKAFKARSTSDRSNAIPAKLTLGARAGKLVITVELEGS